MNDYKKMYYTLFNKITDMIYELQIVQRKTEEMCQSLDPEPARRLTGENPGPDGGERA